MVAERYDHVKESKVPMLPSSLMDSIFLYDAKRLPDVLWEAVMAYGPIGNPDTVHMLRRNMDIDDINDRYPFRLLRRRMSSR